MMEPMLSKKKDGTRILQIFEEQDDAERYVMMLEENGFSNMSVYEIETNKLLQHVKTLGIIMP